jgi:hypothetical protein
MKYAYRDLRARTTWPCRLLYVLAALDVASLFSNHFERGVLRRIADMTAENVESVQAAAARSDYWQKLIAFPQLGLVALTFVLAGMWIYRAATNIRALGAEGLEITPGWSVGWYFVPFANLVKPFQAMNEIWRASQDPHHWERLSTPLELRVWWSLWLAAGVLGNITMRMALNTDKVDELLTLNTIKTVSDLVSLPLDLLFAHVLVRVADLQASLPAPVPAPPALPEPA